MSGQNVWIKRLAEMPGMDCCARAAVYPGYFYCDGLWDLWYDIFGRI